MEHITDKIINYVESSNDVFVVYSASPTGGTGGVHIHDIYQKFDDAVRRLYEISHHGDLYPPHNYEDFKSGIVKGYNDSWYYNRHKFNSRDQYYPAIKQFPVRRQFVPE